MSTVFYPAVIEPDDGSFTVHFPDIPGLYSDGATSTEAALNAEEALNMHLAIAADEGIAIADPSALEAVKVEPGEMLVLVRGEKPGKSLRVQITLEEGLLKRIDRAASNRSAFLADAARAKLAAMA